MSRQNIAIITTSVFQDQFEQGAREQEQKLKNYVAYGYAMDDEQYAKFAFKQPMTVVREVCAVDTNTILLNKTIKFTTTLCCEEESIAEQQREGLE